MEIFEIITEKQESLVWMNLRKAKETLEILTNKLKLTKFESINTPREDGFPVIKEIVSDKVIVSCVKSEVFYKPYSYLEKNY